MMSYDPYRRGVPRETQEVRRVLAEMRQLAEHALRERELALQQRDDALQQRKAALQQRDAALQQREEALHQRDAALRELDEVRQERDQAVAEREQAQRELLQSLSAPAEPRAQELAADLASLRRLRDEHVARARIEEKISNLQALARVHDELLFSLQSNPDRESAWYQGHRAILANVRQALRAAGAVEVGQPGDRFDPRIHEAIGLAAGPPGTVVSVERAGWQLEDGTQIRPAQVRAAA
jgi:molecular chaperone GrpE (heat shock protein)